MTPERYLECLAAVSCSRRGMANYLGIETRSTRRYANGQKLIPENLEAWLEMLAASPDWRATLREHPFPDAWQAAQVGGEWEWVEADDDDADADAAHAEAADPP